MDIRTERTRKMLIEAFEGLCREKNLNDITVTELCEASTVRRATFYRHFSDLRDFVRYYFTTMTDRTLAKLSGSRDLGDLFPYASEMHRDLLGYIDENRVLVRHVMGSGMLTDTMDMVIVQIADGIISRIRKGQGEGAISTTISAESVGMYYAAGLAYAMRRWLLGEGDESVDDLVDAGIRNLRAMLQ